MVYCFTVPNCRLEVGMLLNVFEDADGQVDSTVSRSDVRVSNATANSTLQLHRPVFIIRRCSVRSR